MRRRSYGGLRGRPGFFTYWALFGVAAPLAGAGLLGFDLETTVFVAVGGFVLAAMIATVNQFAVIAEGGRVGGWNGGDMSGGGDGGWSWGGDSCDGGGGGDGGGE